MKERPFFVHKRRETKKQGPGTKCETESAAMFYITRSNLASVLRWPAAAPGFRVQFNTTLGNTNWGNQSGVPVLRGDAFELPGTNAGPRFYRFAAP